MIAIQTVPGSSRSAYLYTIFMALLAWFALGLQLCLTIMMSQDNGSGTLAGIWLYLAFFTILTNLLVALAATWPWLAPASAAGRFFARPAVITAVTGYIILVGVSYNLLLRNTWHPQGLNLIADILLHDVVPIAFVLYWWLNASRSKLDYRSMACWTIYPVVYFLYALIRGALTGFYPYPFLDVPTLGYPKVVLIAFAILAGFLIVAALLIAIARARSRGVPGFHTGS
jgi:hypothetical protein